MIGSLAYGGRLLKEPRYTAAARRAGEFILTRMRNEGRLLRTCRAGEAKLNAYLDDYAFLADAFLELHATTGRKRWLDEARRLTETMLTYYQDPAGGGFFFTSSDHEDLLARTKEPADRAVPSGNAVAASVLVRLARRTGRRKYLDTAREALEAFQGLMQRMPTATASLLLATGEYLDAAAAEAAGTSPTPDAVAEKKPLRIEAFASRLTAAPGETIDLAVRITIGKGWHINSHRPLQKNLVAMAVALKEGSPATLGDVSYPDGREVNFAFSPEALSVYEGTVWVRAAVRLGEQVPASPIELVLTVTAQACNDRTCLSPESHRLTLTLAADSNAKAGATRHPSVFVDARH